MMPGGNDLQWLTQLLTTLDNCIKQLLASLPEGTEDSPIATHLGDWKIDEDEGLFFLFNRSWKHVFQWSLKEQEKLVV